MECTTRKIKMSEFKKNNGEDGNKLWVLIDNKVYDLTDFSHPGGNEILMDEHGTDRIDEFESIHSPAAKKQMTKYLIGEIDLSKEGGSEGENNNKTYTDKKTDKIVTKNETSFNYMIFLPILLIIVFAIFALVKK